MSYVLLFGGGLQVLSVARSLKEYHHRVDVASKDNFISKRSRYVDSCTDVNLKNVDEVLNYIKGNMYDVVVPMEDEYALWLSNYKNRIESNGRTKCAIVEYDLLRTVINKELFLRFCQKNNIPHPKTTGLAVLNIDYAASYVGFPALIKPNFSDGARGIVCVNSIEELAQMAPKQIEEYGDCTLQEFIDNDHYYNVMLYRYGNGEWANYTMTKIVRYYPIKGGSSCYCTSIENDKLLSICKDALDKLNWKGFADFDVLETKTGDFKIIEINPRIPASVKAAAISGVNFGEIIVCDMMSNDRPVYAYKPYQNLRYVGLDVAWFIASPNRFRAQPSWFSFLDKNVYCQEGGFDDFFAMMCSFVSGVKKMLSPSFMKAKKKMN